MAYTYETSDGKEYDSRSAAESHQTIVNNDTTMGFGGMVSDMANARYNAQKAADRAAEDAQDAATAAHHEQMLRDTQIAEPIFFKGVELADAGDWDGALKQFLSAGGYFCRYQAPSYTRAADIYFHQKNDDEQAMKYCDKALEVTCGEHYEGERCSRALVYFIRGEIYFKKMQGESGAVAKVLKKQAVSEYLDALIAGDYKNEKFCKTAASRLKSMGVVNIPRPLIGTVGGIVTAASAFIVAKDWFGGFLGDFVIIGTLIGALIMGVVGIAITSIIKSNIINLGYVLTLIAIGVTRLAGYAAVSNWLLLGGIVGGIILFFVFANVDANKKSVGEAVAWARKTPAEKARARAATFGEWLEDHVGVRGIVFGILAAIAGGILTIVLEAEVSTIIITVAACFVLAMFLSEVGFFKFVIIAGFVGIVGLFVYFNLDDIKSGSFSLTPTAKNVAITSQNVNFRDKPSTDSNIIRQLPQGETITITGEAADGWTPIKHGNDTGWISSEFVKQPTVYTVKKDTFMYKTATDAYETTGLLSILSKALNSSEKIKALEKDTVITLTGNDSRKGKVVEVKHGEDTGWVVKKLLKQAQQ